MHAVFKFVPLTAVPGLAVLCALCAAMISLVAQQPLNDVRTVLLAVPVALVFYFASVPLEAIYDRWYGWGDEVGSRLLLGKGVVLPSGRDLNAARQAAIRAFPAPAAANYPGEGVYQRAKDCIQQKSNARWLEVAKFSALNKLCRGLVVACIFIAVVAGYLLSFRTEFQQGACGAQLSDLLIPTLPGIIALGIMVAPVCFLGFVHLKWEHMHRVFTVGVDITNTASDRRKRGAE